MTINTGVIRDDSLMRLVKLMNRFLFVIANGRR